MTITINIKELHVHVQDPDAYKEVLDKLNTVVKNTGDIMSQQEKFAVAIEKLDAETTRLGTKVQELVDQLKSGGLNETEENAALDKLSAIGDRLAALGKDPGDPVPDEDGTPV